MEVTPGDLRYVHAQAPRLPLSLLAGRDEALDSYLERLAWRHQCSVRDIAARTGLTATASARTPVAGYWITLDEGHRQALSAAVDLPIEALVEMLLERFDGICLRFPETLDGSFRHFAVREWAYLTSSHACPLCLAGRDADAQAAAVWNIAWRLPWSFVCTKHRILLTGACPRCGSRLRDTGRTLPSFSTRLLEPGRCNNSYRPEPHALPSPCGHQLASIDPTPLSNESRPLLAQQTINSILAGQPPDQGGASMLPRDWFAELRSLCALILAAAEPGDLDSGEETVTDAFAAFVDERSAREQQRRIRSAPGGGQTTRLRPYTRVPQQPALMAGVATLAVHILESDQRQRGDLLAVLVERLRRRQPRAIFKLEQNLLLSPRLAHDLQPHISLHMPAALDRFRQQPCETHRFTADHLPQLIEKQLFDRHFAALLPHTRRDFARRFCSMALVRYRHGSTWDDAAKALDLPTPSTTRLAYAITERLTDAGTQERFAAALSDAAAAIDAAPPTNYTARRRALAQLTDLDPQRWQLICEQAGVPVGKPTGRKYAAAWLWCQLTGGDYRLAPALQEREPNRSGEPLITRYTRWLKRDRRVTVLAPYLYASGLEILGHALSSSAHAPSSHPIDQAA